MARARTVTLSRSHHLPQIRTMLRAFAYDHLDGEPILNRTGIDAGEIAELSEALLSIVDAAEAAGLIRQAGEPW